MAYDLPTDLRKTTPEDRDRIISAAGGGRCNELCRVLDSLAERFEAADTEEERRRIIVQYDAVERRREALGCDPCFPV